MSAGLTQDRGVRAESSELVHQPIVHCIYREGLTPVFNSQVLGPMGRLRDAGWDVSLMVFTPLGEWLRRDVRRRWSWKKEAIRKAVGQNYVRIPSPPARLRKLWNEGRVFRSWLKRFNRRNGPPILHCRGAKMAELALAERNAASGCRVIFDCRGIDHAELMNEAGFVAKDQEHPERWAPAMRAFERQWRCAREADAMICVSNEMKRYAVEHFGVDSEKITVVPCCVDVERFAAALSQREAARAELGLSDRFVVVYAGSVRSWQLPDEAARVFQVLQGIEPSAHFLALTPQVERMRRVLAQQGVKEAESTVMAVDHEQVPRYLSAADVGLLLRKPDVVNRVASPVKFGEYLACGVPVVMTEGIRDYSQLVREHSVGAVIPSSATGEDEIESLGMLLTKYREGAGDYRERCRSLVKEHLSKSVYAERMTLVYKRCAEGMPQGW